MAVKHIVGGVMHQHRRVRGRPLRQYSGRLGIDGLCQLGLGLGLVHRGIGRGIDDEMGLVLVQQLTQRFGLGQVGLCPSKGFDLAQSGQGLRQRMPQLTLRAQQGDAQGLAVSHSAGSPTGGTPHWSQR